MKKFLAIALSVVMLLSLSVVFASAAGTPGYYCGGSANDFASVGEITINWDANASDTLNLDDGDMSDWASYSSVSIAPNNMISWVGGTADNQAGGVPEGWGIQAFFVGDAEYLYIGFYVTDPDVALVQDATQYNHDVLGGDAFQFMVDFDGALGRAMEEDPDLFKDTGNPQDGQCVFYSFGPMGEEATPVQIMVQCNADEGVMSEANGDHIKGSTAKTAAGWCAEFALGWDELYADYSWKAYVEDGAMINITEDDPLEINCALYYQNHDSNEQGFSAGPINWAAGTLKNNQTEGQPEIFWNPDDCGVQLLVEYDENMEFECEYIKVYKIGETVPPETDAPETNAPETDAPETNAPETNAPETDAQTDAQTSGSAQTTGDGTTDSGCGSVIGSVAVLLSAVAAAVVLKKKD